MRCSPVTSAMIAGVASCALAGTAAASYTVVNAPSGGESSHLQIFNAVYGGGFSAVGNDFSNGVGPGSITFTRVHDVGSTPLMLSQSYDGTSSDQVWQDGTVSMVARARYAGFSQTFGMYDGAAAGGPLSAEFNSLFSVSGSGTAVSGQSSPFTITGGQFRWGRLGNAGNYHSSVDSENADGMDHLVTYFTTDLTGLPTWVLFWEDVNHGLPNADFDFNDLVVEISVIPLPTPVGLAAAGLLGLAALRRRR